MRGGTPRYNECYSGRVGGAAPGDRRHRPRVTILVKLIAAFTLPTLALFTAFAVVANVVAEQELEGELGRRLSAVAASAATQLRGKYLVDLSADGVRDDPNRCRRPTKRRK